MNVTYVFPASEKWPARQDEPPCAADYTGDGFPDQNGNLAAAASSATPAFPTATREDPASPSDSKLAQTNPAQPDGERATAGSQPVAEAPEPGQPLCAKVAPQTSAYSALTVQEKNLPVKWVSPKSRLILVARARGGMGATSLAVNLAIELQDRKGIFSSTAQRNVALVDFDLQFGTVGSVLDVEDRGGLIALAQLADEPDQQAVRNALLPHRSGIKVLPAPQKAIPLDAFDGIRVGSIIDGLMAEHDYVVVDLPQALVYWMEPLLQRADRLLLVTDLAVPSVTSGRRLIDMMREDNPELRVDIVISREHKPLFQRQLHRDVASALGGPLCHWLPDEIRLSRKAIDRGEPLVEMSPRCAWSRAVRNLAQSIEANSEAQTSSTGETE